MYECMHVFVFQSLLLQNRILWTVKIRNENVSLRPNKENSQQKSEENVYSLAVLKHSVTASKIYGKREKRSKREKILAHVKILAHELNIYR